MLVLVSFGLVLIATVLLILGLVRDSGLGLIYLSIGCSLFAGVLLLAATRMTKARPVAALPTGVQSPLPEPTIRTSATR